MSMTRWGILGASKFARQRMGPAIAHAHGAELSAIATRDPQKAEPFKSLNANIRVYDSYDALIDDPHIDAIYVPLPNDMHTPYAIKSMRAGKPVLIEKPASLSVAEMDQLIATRDETGVFAAEAFMIVHHPQWLKMREIYQSGILGDLSRVDGVFSFNNQADRNNIRHQSQRGGGSVRDIGVYPYGAVRFVTGQEPQQLLFKRSIHEFGVEVTTRVLAQFDDFEFSALTSMRMGLFQRMEFHGTKAIARLSAPFNAGVYGSAALELNHTNGHVETFSWQDTHQYVLQVEAFQRAVQGAPYACPLEFSRGTQAMIDDILA